MFEQNCLPNDDHFYRVLFHTKQAIPINNECVDPKMGSVIEFCEKEWEKLDDDTKNRIENEPEPELDLNEQIYVSLILEELMN